MNRPAERVPETDPAPPSGRAVLPWILLGATLLLVLSFRVRLLDLPLERDEGEFALLGRMILEGTPPYSEAYNLKPPGIYLAYAAVMAVFGQSAAGIHAGLLAVNLGCALFVFLAGRRLRGDRFAAHSTAAFLALSAMPRVLGYSAHATHFVLLPALWGTWMLLREEDDPLRGATRTAWAGFLMGVSFLVKQPGLFFVLFGALAVARTSARGGRWIALTMYAAGAALPVFLALVWLWSGGVFDRFWFWVVEYALRYGSQVGIAEGIGIALSVGGSIAYPSLAFVALGVAGSAALARGGPAGRRERFFLFAFLAASALAVAMGFHFRRHYFVLALPAAAFLAGAGLEAVAGFVDRKVGSARAAALTGTFLGALAVAQTVISGWPVSMAVNPDDASRILFGANPFVESPEIGARIAALTKEGDRIAVVGSEPQLYFHSGRRPATGYLYTYSLVETQPYAATMRDEMIAEIEGSAPAAVVYVQHPSSWLLRPGSDLSVFRWFRDYRAREGYVRAGLVEWPASGPPVSAWGEESARAGPRGDTFIEILVRPPAP